MLPCSLSHMLTCLPAPKSICSVNKLASLTARKLPLGSQCWEELQQTFPLRVLTWTPRQSQAQSKWVLVPALAPSGAGDSWLEARSKWGSASSFLGLNDAVCSQTSVHFHAVPLTLQGAGSGVPWFCFGMS